MSKQRRAEFYLLLITAVWGSTFVVTKALVEENSPLFYTGIRFILAAVLVILVFFRRARSIPFTTWKKGTVLGILLFAGFALQTVGIQYTTASKSAFFTGMLVVLTPIVHISLQRVFGLDRRILRVGNVLGVLLCAAGLFLLTSPAGGGFTLGDLLTLGCALLFAVYIVYLDHASVEPDKLQLTLVQFVVCGILGLVSSAFLEEVRVSLTTDYLLSLGYLTVFATVIAMWVQNQYQGDTHPTRAAIIYALEPVIAAIFAYFVRGEMLGSDGLIGAGIVVAGLLLSEFSEDLPIVSRAVAGR